MGKLNATIAVKGTQIQALPLEHNMSKEQGADLWQACSKRAETNKSVEEFEEQTYRQYDILFLTFVQQGYGVGLLRVQGVYTATGYQWFVHENSGSSEIRSASASRGAVSAAFCSSGFQHNISSRLP